MRNKSSKDSGRAINSPHALQALVTSPRRGPGLRLMISSTSLVLSAIPKDKAVIAPSDGSPSSDTKQPASKIVFTSAGVLSVTAGGAGSSGIGQFVSEITVID